ESPHGIEPLCGIYRRAILPEAAQMLKNGDHRLTTLLETVKTKYVKFATKEPFLNLNRPDEYQEALERLL
ncbi:MAG: molybdenum cofactor guanylyltransferase, partial [Sulfurovum sp.]|nr:molybdenum cofactor guanylyltransferase [Sulfurovum sp.]